MYIKNMNQSELAEFIMKKDNGEVWTDLLHSCWSADVNFPPKEQQIFFYDEELNSIGIKVKDHYDAEFIMYHSIDGEEWYIA